jgi:hypothetical protein
MYEMVKETSCERTAAVTLTRWDCIHHRRRRRKRMRVRKSRERERERESDV